MNVLSWVADHKKVLIIIGCIILFLSGAWLCGYWQGGREVAGSCTSSGQSSGNDTGTTELVGKVKDGQRQVQADIQQAGRDSTAAEESIRAAEGAVDSLRQSLDAGSDADTEIDNLIREGLSIADRDEQIFRTVESSNKKGTVKSQEK